MAKIKVHELAKEIDRSSKEVVAFLQENGIEAKAAQSSVEDAAADMVRKHFGGKTQETKVEETKVETPKAEAPKAEAPKAEEAKTEAPKKKKNIVFISNPQYSKMPGGQRPPMKNNNPKPNNKPAQEAKPAQKPIQLGPNQMINKSTGKVMEMLPPKKPEVVETPVVVAQEEKAPVRNNRDNRDNRNSQERPNNNQNRFTDRNNERGNDRNNERGNDRNFNRPQGDDRRTGDRNYAGKPGQKGNNNAGYGDRPNNGNNKGSYQGNNNNKDANRGFKDNERSQGRNERQDSKFQSKKDNKSFAADAPMMQNDKHREEQRRLNQAKDKRSKKDSLYEDKEVEIKNKNKAGRFIKPEPKPVEPEEQIKVITVPETITIKELAEKMKMQPAAIIKKLFMQGKIVTVNQEVSFEDAENIAIEFDIMCEQEVKVYVI